MPHQLQAVTNPEHRNSQLEDFGIRLRRFRIENTRWSSGQNNPFRRERGDLFGGGIVPQNDGIHITLAYSSCDDLGVLRPKVQYNNLLHRFCLMENAKLSSRTSDCD